MATCNETLSEEITDVNKVLDTLDPEQRTIIVKAFMAMETERTFRGPLPAPEDFRAYGEVIPNAPERILSMTEQQVSHRIHTEEKIVKSGLAESRIGQWMGLFHRLDSHRALHVIGIQWTRLGSRSNDDGSHWLVSNLCVTAETK